LLSIEGSGKINAEHLIIHRLKLERVLDACDTWRVRPTRRRSR
jgi:hypothetical protein